MWQRMRFTLRFHQGFETSGVKCVRSVFEHDGEDFFEGKRIAIRALGPKGVKHICNRENARVQGEFLCVQSAPITFAIKALVVGSRVITKIREGGDAAQNLVGEVRMPADGVEFLRGQLSRFLEDGIGNAKLADIVEQAGAAQTLQVLLTEAKEAANVDSGVGNPGGMLVGKGSLGIDDFSESNANAVYGFVICREAPISWFHRQDFGVQVVLFEVFPESAAFTEGDGGFDKARAKPTAAAGSIDGISLAASAEKNFQGLREVGDIRKDGNLSVAKTVWIATAIPMLVETVDARSDTFREAKFAGDLGATFAANLYQLAGITLLCGSNLNHFPDALWVGRGRSHMGYSVVQAFPADTGPIHRFQIAFCAQIVGVEDVSRREELLLQPASFSSKV